MHESIVARSYTNKISADQWENKLEFIPVLYCINPARFSPCRCKKVIQGSNVKGLREICLFIHLEYDRI